MGHGMAHFGVAFMDVERERKLMTGFRTDRLSAIEDDATDVSSVPMEYRPVKLTLSVKSFSDQNAIGIGLAILQVMRDDGIIGPTDGDVGLDQ